MTRKESAIKSLSKKCEKLDVDSICIVMDLVDDIIRLREAQKEVKDECCDICESIN